MNVNLFCGAGGWDDGMRQLGLSALGIDIDRASCATRRAAGYETLQADVSSLDPATYRDVVGLIASPPCEDWSNAGKRAGRAGKTGELVDEVMRWARVLEPEWVACEQVPGVLPIWREFAAELRTMGYSTWAGKLDTANYGEVITCPLHADDIACRSDPVRFAERLSESEIVLDCAGAPAMTPCAGEPIRDAIAVVGHLAKEIRPVFAASATCDARVNSLLRLVQRAQPIRDGLEGDTWMREAMSDFELMGNTSGSIGLWLRNLWDDLYAQGRLSTTSTEVPITTIHRILKSIAATLIIGLHTGPASRTAGCGLCLDRGVPQNRVRAILMASRTQFFVPPQPTHSKRGGRTIFGETLLPWVSMAEALGWGLIERPATTMVAGSGHDPMNALNGGSGARQVYKRAMESSRFIVDAGQPFQGTSQFDAAAQPSRTIRRKTDAWSLRNNSQDHGTIRRVDEPAPTLFFGHALNDVSWVQDRPATTIVGSFLPDVVAGPGHHEGSRQDASGSIRITLEQGLILQGFRPDYPLQGSRTSKFAQLGSAFPPPVAAAIIGELVGMDWRQTLTQREDKSA